MIPPLHEALIVKLPSSPLTAPFTKAESALFNSITLAKGKGSPFVSTTLPVIFCAIIADIAKRHTAVITIFLFIVIIALFVQGSKSREIYKKDNNKRTFFKPQGIKSNSITDLNPNRSLGLVVFRSFRRMNFACLLMSDSELLRIKNKQKASYKSRKTARSYIKILIRPNDRFGLKRKQQFSPISPSLQISISLTSNFYCLTS